MKEIDALLVSITNDILVVGRKRPNESVEIINAFQGDEAKEIYQKLITKRGMTDNAKVSG